MSWLKFRTYPPIIKKLFLIYLIGFSVGTTTHIIDLIIHGWILNESVPLWKNMYWVSLTFFDFLAILLILSDIKSALIISNLIIISDVIINTDGFTANWLDLHYKVILQLIFCLYIVITTPIILKAQRNTILKANTIS
jgi:hypothetical protein